MSGMNEPMHPRRVLDMTPDGAFREAPKLSGFNLLLVRMGGVAMLIAVAAGGFLLVALAIFFIGLLLPIVIGAGSIAALSIWWRRRRLRRVGIEPGPIRIVVRR